MRIPCHRSRLFQCIVLRAASAAVLALWGCGDGEGEPKAAGTARRIINVEVETLAVRSFTDVIRLTGVVLADREVTLAAEESGTVVQILADKGESVSRGQPLIELNDELLRVQRSEAEAQAVLAAEIWRRKKRLYEEERIGTEGEYLEARYTADQTRARLNLIEARLRRTVVRAPFDGLLDRRLVDVGSVVSPGQAVAHILDLEPLKVATGVPERYAADVGVGTRAVVAFEALADTCAAILTYVGAAVDGGHRTFPVELALERPVASAKPAMVAEVHLVRRVYPQVLVVPRQALVRTEDGFSAFVAIDGEAGPLAEVRPVTLGASGGDQVVVTSGLLPADRLIVVGQQQVANGDRLSIVSERHLRISE